jgi:hypothetical protein
MKTKKLLQYYIFIVKNTKNRLYRAHFKLSHSVIANAVTGHTAKFRNDGYKYEKRQFG